MTEPTEAQTPLEVLIGEDPLDYLDVSTSPDDYQDALDRLLVAARLVASVDLSGMRKILDACDSVGPILDPTAWRGAAADGSLEEQSGIVDSFASTLGLGELLDRIDGRYPDGEGTAGVAAAAAALLRLGRGSRADRPRRRAATEEERAERAVEAYGEYDLCTVSDVFGCPYCWPSRRTDLNGVIDVDAPARKREAEGHPTHPDDDEASLLASRIEHAEDRRRRGLPVPEELAELAAAHAEATVEIPDRPRLPHAADVDAFRSTETTD